MKSRDVYTNIGAEIWISSMLKIMKGKGIIKEGELEEAIVQSLKDFKDGKFTKVTITEKEDK